MHLVPICMLFVCFGGFFNYTSYDRVHCTLCGEKEDEPNSGVQQCKCNI